MKKIIVLLLIVLSASAQIKKPMITTREFKIESGKTLLTYKNEKLDSIQVAMYAVNYGNLITFSRTKDTIYGEMADSKNTKIKVFFKYENLTYELIHKKKSLFCIEIFKPNFSKLPSNSKVSGRLENNSNIYYNTKTTLQAPIDKAGEEEMGDLDKIFKLYAALNFNLDLKSIDTVFENLGTYFSKEDCLYKIFMGKYAAQFTPKFTAFFSTDTNGKIKDGILWKSTDLKIGISETFKNGKIIQSEQLILKNFQKAIEKYAEKNIE